MATPARDHVDLILDHVRVHEPDADLAAKAVQMRLRRAAHHFDTATQRRLAPQGMEIWEIEILATLVRGGGSLTMGQLNTSARLTSGAITNRVARLEERGHVTRAIDPQDRRQIVVALTPTGEQRLGDVIEVYNAAESEIFAGLDRELLARIADDLRVLLLAIDTD